METLHTFRKQTSAESSDRWIVWGRSVPKSEIVFFCQTFVIILVIISAIINISLGNKSETWLILLSTSVGAALPNPTIKSHRSNRAPPRSPVHVDAAEEKVEDHE